MSQGNWQRRARAGEPLQITAAAYNNMLDSAVRSRRRGVSAVHGELLESASLVRLVNNTDSPISQYQPVRVTNSQAVPLIERDRRITLMVDAIGSGDGATVVVATRPIRPGTSGFVAVSGCCIAQVQHSTAYPLTPGLRLGLQRGQFAFAVDPSGPATAMSGPVASTGGHVAIVRLGVGGGEWDAIIGANPVQLGNAARWQYEWAEASLDGDDNEWVAVSGGMTSASSGRALNSLEADNTSTEAYSIPVVGPLFEIGGTGVRFRPVPAGTVVRMRRVHSGGQSWMYTFSAPNPVWGPCEASATLAAMESAGGET